MSLDPQMAGVLAAMEGQDKPDFATYTAVQLRQDFANMPLPTGLTAALKNVRDQQIVGPAGEIPARIYQPDSTTPLPLLVYFHGGGFVVGDLNSHDHLCRALSHAIPAVVVAVDYRLAPEHKFPGAVDDAYAATQWAAEHAAQLEGDRSRLMVGGDSAGGNIAAVVCQQARDIGSPAIAHQLLLYPVCDNDLRRDSYQRLGKGYFLETEMMSWFWTQYLNSADDGLNAKACPLKGNAFGLPSATIVTAEYDPLRDEGEAYARLLSQADVAVEHFCVPGAIHGFLSFVGMLPLANITLERAAAAVNGAIGNQATAASKPL